MRILLIGFMGAGKSTVAQLLAHSLALPVFELDDLIVKCSDERSIPEIFQKLGEEYFRSLENAVLTEVLSEPTGIISSGGGIVERGENREAIQKSAPIVIFLEAPFSVIQERIGDISTRPLFKDPTVAKARFLERQQHYRELATLTVPTANRTPEEIAATICRCIGRGSTIDVQMSERQLSSSAPRVHAVIGDPISHSISPYIHNACYSRLQSDVLRDLFVSQRVKKDEIEDFLTTWRSSSALHGLAITIPLKEVALEYLDSLSADTIRIGAVNTVVKQGGELHGENTDWIGIARPLQNRLDLRGLKCCVLGGGGTARAAIYALRQSGAAVVVVNRTASKAEKLAELFSVECRAMSDVPQLQDFDVVVQTTSVGLKEDVSLYPSEAFREGMVVMDVVYSPQKTRFLKNAEQVGARIVTGDEMFIAQAEAQFKLHSGYSAPEGLMQKALEECLCR